MDFFLKKRKIIKMLLLVYLTCIFVGLSLGVVEIYIMSKVVMPEPHGIQNWLWHILFQTQPWLHAILTGMLLIGTYKGAYGNTNRFWIVICCMLFLWGWYIVHFNFFCIARIVLFDLIGVLGFFISNKTTICQFQLIDLYTTAVVMLPACFLNLRYAFGALSYSNRRSNLAD